MSKKAAIPKTVFAYLIYAWDCPACGESMQIAGCSTRDVQCSVCGEKYELDISQCPPRIEGDW